MSVVRGRPDRSGEVTQEEQSDPGRLLSVLDWFRWLSVFSAIALVISGVIVRLSIRDANLLAGLIFYTTSPASMCVLLMLAILGAGRSRRRLRVFLSIALMSVCLWMLNAQWVRNPVSEGRHDRCRLLFWNVCDGKLGWAAIESAITQESPEIIALAEAETLKPRGAEWFDRHYPGFERLDLPRRLMLLSKWPIVSRRRLAWIRGGVYEAVSIRTGEGDFTLVFSDIQSNILTHRKTHIGKLHEVLQPLSGPVIFVGDLNTPVDSAFFDPIREEFSNAFEAAGSGLHTTWPMPLPVIAIDHIWGNAEIEFHQTRILWTLRSDHRPIVTDFSLN